MNDFYNKNHANFIKSMGTTLSDVVAGVNEVYSPPKRMKFTSGDFAANILDESCTGLTNSLETCTECMNTMEDSILEFKNKMSIIFSHFENN